MKIDISEIKAVFFDRGNVAYDCKLGPREEDKDRDAAYRACACLGEHGVRVGEEAVYTQFVAPWKASFSQRQHRGHEIPVSEFLIGFLDGLRFEYENSLLDEVVHAMSVAYLRWHELDAELPSLLEKLRGAGKRTGIVSNAVFPDTVYTDQLKSDGLMHLLDVCVFSGSAGTIKPHKRMIELACEPIGIRPVECVLIGDKLEKDVLCARNAGAVSVWYNKDGIENSTDIVADYEIRSFSEMEENLLL